LNVAMITYTLSKVDRNLKGEITLSPSKTINNRALVFRVLKHSGIDQKSLAEQEEARVLDAQLLKEGIKKNKGVSAKAIRHIRSFFNYFGGEWVLSCSDVIKGELIERIVKVLQKQGLQVSYEERRGVPPFKLIGRGLQGSIIRVDGQISSKHIQASLILSPKLPGSMILELKDAIIKSSYIEMTLKALQYLGVNTDWDSNEILIEHEFKDGSEITLEADWCSATYWFQMVALSKKADITIKGLSEESTQYDSEARRLFEAFGVKAETVANGIRLMKQGRLAKNFDFDFANNPDLVPSVAVTAAALKVPFRLRNVSAIRQKDSDRVESLSSELKKIGATLRVEKEGDIENLCFDGKLLPVDSKATIGINTHNDHRIAMAFAPLMMLGYQVIIDNPRVTSKSYAAFWDDLKRLGVEIEQG